jgi:radical SAM protein with 4Fe4S-binding SPASM domain
MKCLHCRASAHIGGRDMPLNGVKRILQFAKLYSSPGLEVMLSGGEPLLHQQFGEVIKLLKQCEIPNVTITTNGALLSKRLLEELVTFGFERLTISVSIDSTCSKRHDEFRGMENAFAFAERALKIVNSFKHLNVRNSMRVSVRPHMIGSLTSFVEKARNIQCDAVSLSSIYPHGRAKNRSDFCMTQHQNNKFLSEIRYLSKTYADMEIKSNDPLYILTTKNIYDVFNESEYGGCVAGIFQFNVNTDGKVTPCPLIDAVIMNAFDPLIDLANTYVNSSIVKKLVARELDGKCSSCFLKALCGGCRARAYLYDGNMFKEDPHCWQGHDFKSHCTISQ